MSLYSEIEKVTMVPETSNDTEFVELNGLSQAAKDRKINERKLKRPKNIELMEDDDLGSFGNVNSQQFINEHEIASSIKIAHGGISFSNDYLEQHFQSIQRKEVDALGKPESAWYAKNINSSTICNTSAESDQCKQDLDASKLSEEMKDTPEDKREILQKCGLSRNAAICALFMQDKISIKDLYIYAIDSTSVPSKEDTSTQNDSGTCDEIIGRSGEIDLVPLPEDPDVFVRSWQAYGQLDSNRRKKFNFTVERVGKRKTVSARQYYINETDDSSFQFVKKTASKPSR